MDNILGVDMTGSSFSPNYGRYQAKLQTDAMRENLEEGIGLPTLVATITKTYEPGMKAIKNVFSSVSELQKGTPSLFEKLGENIPEGSNLQQGASSPFGRGYEFRPQPSSNRITDLPEFSNKVSEPTEMRNFAADDSGSMGEATEETVGNLENITGAFTRLTSSLPNISDITKAVKPFLSVGGDIGEGAELGVEAGTSLLEAASGVGLVGAIAGLGGLLGSLFKPGPKAPTIPNIVSLPQFHF